MSFVVAFQPGLATRLVGVVETMHATHDVLIVRAGRRRASGVTWEIWGGELAGVLARTKTHVSVREGTNSQISGSLAEGLDRLEELFDGSFGDDGSHADEAGVGPYRLLAAANPDATLIIAFCEISVREEATR